MDSDPFVASRLRMTTGGRFAIDGDLFVASRLRMTTGGRFAQDDIRGHVRFGPSGASRETPFVPARIRPRFVRHAATRCDG